MKKTIQILVIITLISVAFYSCSKKEEGCTDVKATNFNPDAEEDDGSCTYCYDPSNIRCVNYDPCYTSKPVTAWFDAFEKLGLNQAQNADTFVVTTDKFLLGGIKFEAKEKDANYTWRIGSETLHDRSFIRSFSSITSVRQTIPVTLIVNKTPDSICNPNDNGIDSLTRYFQVVDRCESLLNGTVNGAFVGVWKSAPLDTFELGVLVYTLPGDLSDCNNIDLWNFNKQNERLTGQQVNISYHNIRLVEAIPTNFTTNFRILKLDSDGTAANTSLTGIVGSDQKTVEFKYRIHNDDTGVMTDHHFIGRKKN